MNADQSRESPDFSRGVDVNNPHSDVPRYRQAAAALRGWITDGTWQPGDELPPEKRLADQMQVGKDTIRAALAVLRQEGLVDTTRGYRSVVREQRKRTPVHVPAGLPVTARMPTPIEREDLDIREGVPIFEIGGPGGELHPADRTVLLFGPPNG